METGIIFDIKRYAIHDGPGIRTTVFFKGCALRCAWCHNPEGLNPEKELVYLPSRCLESCTACVTACRQEAITRRNGVLTIDRGRCRLAGDCGLACPTEALRVIGREMSVAEVIAELTKDRIFYDTSGGGVTFSGGEPLQQPEFLNALLETCRIENLPTAVDTSGHAPWEVLEMIRDKTDLFLYDLKVMGDQKHRAMTGVSNAVILENLKRLAELKKSVRVRLPLIAGWNDGAEDIRALREFLASLSDVKDISLLPYHRLGSQKYKNLNIPTGEREFTPPSQARINDIRAEFENSGFHVKIGG